LAAYTDGDKNHRDSFNRISTVLVQAITFQLLSHRKSAVEIVGQHLVTLLMFRRFNDFIEGVHTGVFQSLSCCSNNYDDGFRLLVASVSIVYLVLDVAGREHSDVRARHESVAVLTGRHRVGAVVAAVMSFLLDIFLFETADCWGSLRDQFGRRRRVRPFRRHLFGGAASGRY